MSKLKIPLTENFGRDIFYCVYHITNEMNGRMYIGECGLMDERLKQHRHQLKRGIHHNTEFQDEFNRYGIEAFTVKVVSHDGMPQKKRVWESNEITKHLGTCYNKIQDGARSYWDKKNADKNRILHFISTLETHQPIRRLKYC